MSSSSGHPIFVRIMLLFIVASFVLWGIGDIFRAGGGPGTVAKVGKMSVSMNEYKNALRARQEQMREQLGKDYSPELMKKLGLEHQALESIINRLLLEQEAASLGMVAGEDDVADYISTAPEFLDQGQFSKEQYLAVLAQNHRSEQSYVSALQSQLATKLLLQNVTQNMPIPDDLVQAFYRARYERRAADILVIPANVTASAAPSEKDIKTYYEEHNDKYMIPEYRALSFVELKPETMQAGITVSDAEVQKAYADRADEYKIPERRVIEQLVFEKKETADQASAELAAGKSFAQVAASLPVTNKDKLSLGELTKQNVPVAADEVFALKEGGYTKPAQSGFGFHILKVEKILPAGQRPLADVREQIVKDISSKTAEEAVFKLSNNFEDALGGGATLDDAAKKLGQQVQHVTYVNRDGVPLDGSKQALPAYSNFLDVAFATANKDHSRMVQAADSAAYFMVHVDGVKVAHAKPLAEVLPQVTESVKKEQAGKQMSDYADSVAKALKAGKKLEEALAGKVTAVFEPAGALMRMSENGTEGKFAGKPISPAVVNELFKVKPGAFTGAYAMPDGSYMIGKLDHVVAAPAVVKDSPVLKPIRDDIEKAWSREAQYAYLQHLREKYTVKVNNKALELPVQNDEE